MIRLLSNPKSKRLCPSKRRMTESLYCKRRRTRTLTYWRKNKVESATQSREVSRLQPKYNRKRRKLYMHRDLKYRSKLLYLVRTSWVVCVDPQAECMQVVWGPWKLRTRRGMGITGMGVHRSLNKQHARSSVDPASDRTSFRVKRCRCPARNVRVGEFL